MSECIHCGATDNVDGGVFVGLVGELNENVCNHCRADHLRDHTVLKRQESEVAALKEQSFTHAEIGNMLGIAKGTVDKYSQRISGRVRRANTTADELQQFA